MNDVIEQAARVLAGLEPGEDWPTNESLGGGMTGTRDDEYRQEMIVQARELADDGLLARPLPTRDEIAEVIEVEILDFFDWPGLHPDLPYATADAVLALLKGQDA